MAFNCGLLLNSGDLIVLNDGTSGILLNDATCDVELGSGATTPALRPSGIGLPADDRGYEKAKVLSQIEKLIAEIEARGPEPELLPTAAELQAMAHAELMAELERVKLQHHLMLLAEDEELVYLLM